MIFTQRKRKSTIINQYQQKELDDFEQKLAHKYILYASPVPKYLHLLEQAFEGFDRLIVISSKSGIEKCKELASKMVETSFLFVPVSIHNDVAGSEQSLGHDTAMNNIIKDILKIEDTIRSLKYDKPRLFGIQLPGVAPKEMLQDLAMAVEGQFLQSDFDKGSIKAVEDNIQSTYANGRNYHFLLFDEKIDSETVLQDFLPHLVVDWRVNEIDQSLCMGSRPTAVDRILGIKFAKKIVEWVVEQGETGVLLVEKQQVEVR